MVQEKETKIPWHIKSKLVVMAVKKAFELDNKNQVIFPVRNRVIEFQVYKNRVFFWFNTSDRSTHGVHIDLIDGKFPPN